MKPRPSPLTCLRGAPFVVAEEAREEPPPPPSPCRDAWNMLVRRRKCREVEGIAAELALKDGSGRWDTATEKAISSMFFAAPGEPRTHLLKRGPIVLNGEQRELLLFTTGFLFARADLDELSRREIRDYFRSVKKRLKPAALDRLMNQYDVGPDGTISQRGFESMLSYMLGHPPPTPGSDGPVGLSWWSLGNKLRRAAEGTGIPQKPDVAFRWADVRKVEAGCSRGGKSASPARLALAVHVKGTNDPLVLTCAWPEDFEAWTKAFRTCVRSRQAPPCGMPVGRHSRLWNGRVKPSLEPTWDDGTDITSQMSSGSSSSEENDEVAPSDRSVMLTDEERNDNAEWRRRLSDRSKFCRGYAPQRWEREEMDAIARHLALRDPRAPARPSFPRLEKEASPSKGKEERGQQITKEAIESVFFAEPWEPQSVLAKRGPVLLDGEERELMVFTNGFLFSRVEPDAIASRLFEGATDPTLERLRERFREIDADGSGALDRGEILDFFRGTGVPLSEPALDRIMNKYDLDSNGAISWEEFQRMTRRSFLRMRLRTTFSRFVDGRRLDAAFTMADVRKVEHLGLCHSGKTELFADSEWAHLTLAVHVRGRDMPLLVTCAKPGHVEAWMEAFRACIAGTESAFGGDPPGMILGRALRNEKERKTYSVTPWRETELNDSEKSIDWGVDYDGFRTSLL